MGERKKERKKKMETELFLFFLIYELEDLDCTDSRRKNP
jgi:hypothetical protein